MVQVIIAAILLISLVLPIYILFHSSQILQGSDVIGPSLGVLVAFTLAFCGVFYMLSSMVV